jgi:hypothetical protein
LTSGSHTPSKSDGAATAREATNIPISATAIANVAGRFSAVVRTLANPSFLQSGIVV